MTRDTDALRITEKWAGSGDAVTPESQGLTRAAGWTGSYSTAGGDLPKREVFNGLFLEITALLVELNTRGWLDWDASTTFIHPAFVVGSDGSVYASVQGSVGQDPTTDTTDTYWTLFGELADGAVSTAKLADSAVKTDKIADKRRDRRQAQRRAGERIVRFA